MLLITPVLSYAYEDEDPIEKKVNTCYQRSTGTTAESLNCSDLAVKLYDEGSQKYLTFLLAKAAPAEKSRIRQDQNNWKNYSSLHKKSADAYLTKLNGTMYVELVAAHYMTLSKDRYFHLKFLAMLKETSICPMDEC